MARRGRYDFPRSVKDKAKADWRANHPGCEDTNLEVHHRIPVHFAKDAGIPPDLVRIQDNAVALTRREHKDFHRNEPTDEEYRTIVQGILGWIGGLF